MKKRAPLRCAEETYQRICGGAPFSGQDLQGDTVRALTNNVALNDLRSHFHGRVFTLRADDNERAR